MSDTRTAPAAPAPADTPAPAGQVTALAPLAPAEAAARLRTGGTRGFLDLDPVTQNDALIVRLLAEQDATVFAHGDALVGARPNPGNPRQAVVATTSADPEPLAALAEFLRVYRRHTSLVAVTGADEPARTALAASGFTEVGVLRGHWYRSGAYHDAHLHHLPLEPQ
ncbi:hypothetical protein [Actinacidiphila sp. ITFR-21]|uniref:hypothetical protein n=1 Tax=Actinacidiphila sp. ITFR-21 TaxID=3075199 RepID=UPI00288AF382|nr:hypothetical protein [Streptomyces sp. ITFR-21]WNI18961.1 hypothetical protein RLT57_27795 [Streptomyces sp. ITFR-21]